MSETLTTAKSIPKMHDLSEDQILSLGSYALEYSIKSGGDRLTTSRTVSISESGRLEFVSVAQCPYCIDAYLDILQQDDSTRRQQQQQVACDVCKMTRRYSIDPTRLKDLGFNYSFREGEGGGVYKLRGRYVNVDISTDNTKDGIKVSYRSGSDLESDLYTIWYPVPRPIWHLVRSSISINNIPSVDIQIMHLYYNSIVRDVIVGIRDVGFDGYLSDPRKRTFEMDVQNSTFLAISNMLLVACDDTVSGVCTSFLMREDIERICNLPYDPNLSTTRRTLRLYPDTCMYLCSMWLAIEAYVRSYSWYTQDLPHAVPEYIYISSTPNNYPLSIGFKIPTACLEEYIACMYRMYEFLTTV